MKAFKIPQSENNIKVAFILNFPWKFNIDENDKKIIKLAENVAKNLSFELDSYEDKSINGAYNFFKRGYKTLALTLERYETK